LGLVFCLVAAQWTGMLSCSTVFGNVQQAEISTRDYRPVTFSRYEDVWQLKSLIEHYNDAWVKYANDGDKAVFGYILAGSELFEQAESFRNDGYTRELLLRSVEAIDFATTGNTAYVKVFERLKKSSDTGREFIEYDWVYEAVYFDGRWQLSRCTLRDDIANRWLTDNKVIQVNKNEYLVGNTIFYTNPWDADRPYKMSSLGNGIVKLSDYSAAMILPAAGGAGCLVINKSNKDVASLNSDGKSEFYTKIWTKYGDDGWDYFCNRQNIYKARKDRSEYILILSREVSGMGMRIKAVRDGWVYFRVSSEDGVAARRVRTDGSEAENLAFYKQRAIRTVNLADDSHRPVVDWNMLRDISRISGAVEEFYAALGEYREDGKTGVFQYSATGSEVQEWVKSQSGAVETPRLGRLTGIDFSADRLEARVKVHETRESGAGNDVILDANKRADDSWIFSRRTKGGELLNRVGDFVVINGKAFLYDDQYIYYADPAENDKLYKMHVLGAYTVKVLDDSVIIIDGGFKPVLFFINLTKNNEVYALDTAEAGEGKPPWKVAMAIYGEGWNFFHDEANVYRVKPDGSAFARIVSIPLGFSRGIENLISDGEWLYFSRVLQQGKVVSRVRLDGTELEEDWIVEK
jgi:hypothetical protein